MQLLSSGFLLPKNSDEFCRAVLETRYENSRFAYFFPIVSRNVEKRSRDYEKLILFNILNNGYGGPRI